MEASPLKAVSVQEESMIHAPNVSESSLTAKDGLFIATECHLALLPDEDGDTALHLAVVQGDVGACRKLGELFRIAGKSIDVHNNLLQTPLHVAVITNHKEIVKLLLFYGSDPNSPDRYGSTAFHLCAKYNHGECLTTILNNIGKRKPGLNVQDYDGLTALHVAVRYGSVDTFKFLITSGADINARDNKGGRTPLIYAIEMNENAIVEILLECDASVSQQTYSGDTALHIASGRGQHDIVRLLLKRGADATMRNTHSETPISLAASSLVASDIMRTLSGLNAASETKALTALETQCVAYITRTTTSPQILNMFNTPLDNKVLARNTTSLESESQRKKIKIVDCNKSDGETFLPKRPPIIGLRSPITVKLPFLPSKNEWVQRTVLPNNKSPATNNQTSIVDRYKNEKKYAISIMRSKNTDDEIEKKPLDFSEEDVEIAMEEVEVSAGEELDTRSDDESVPDFPPTMSNVRTTSKTVKQCSPHKLMQHLANNFDKFSRDDKISNGEGDAGKGPVFVAVESQSVPNGPQPTELNLYQLAREGLAVAAMANSSVPHRLSNRDFGLCNYLKARPSRQAKIKSGTEELQNLALQGLAVAAMNEFEKKAISRKRSAQDSDLSTVRKLLTDDVHPGKDVNLPQLHRSNSMPQKQNFQGETAHKPVFQCEESSLTNLSSDRALLVLAHANARKEHVGQAISAKSMVSAQNNNTTVKRRMAVSEISTVSNNMPDCSKLNLRQAIKVKGTNVVSPVIIRKVPGNFDPLRQKFEVYDPSNIGIKICNTELGFSNASHQALKFVSSASPVMHLTSSNGQKENSVAATKAVCSLLTTATVPSHDARSSIHVSSAVSLSKKTELRPHCKVIKEPTPTHTVAPLQVGKDNGMAFIRRKTDKDKQQTLISVTVAPVVASRVSSPSASGLIQTSTVQKLAKDSEVFFSATLRTPALPSALAAACTTVSMPQIAQSVQRQLSVPTLANLELVGSHAGSQYFQPQIAYIPHGKDLIPVLMPPNNFSPHLSQHAALHPHRATQATTTATSEESMITNTPVNHSLPISHAYSTNVLQLPLVGHSNLLYRLPIPFQDLQMGGLYPTAAPLYYSPQHQSDFLLHQQLIKNVPSFTTQNASTAPVAMTVGAASKPVAAVSAVPVQKAACHSDLSKVMKDPADEEPLNLSKRSVRSPPNHTDQPLNLMKGNSGTLTKSSPRGSVIKAILSVESNGPKNPEVAPSPTVSVSTLSSLGENQMTPRIFIPPPIIVNPGTVQSAAFSSFSPIHCVNGMPAIFGAAPQLQKSADRNTSHFIRPDIQ